MAHAMTLKLFTPRENYIHFVLGYYCIGLPEKDIIPNNIKYSWPIPIFNYILQTVI